MMTPSGIPKTVILLRTSVMSTAPVTPSTKLMP